MIEQPDLLAERFAALTNRVDDSDWLDVRRRARTAPRRWLLIPVAAAIAVIAVGSAFAVYRELVDFISAEPAPENVKVNFADLNAGAPPGMAPGVVASKARGVLRRKLHGRQHTLWVAPTESGGFCAYLLGPRGGGGGGCTAAGVPLSSGAIQPNEDSPLGVFGSVAARDSTYVDVVHEDGSTTRVDLVWVSPPIDAGFFVAEVPVERGVIGFVARSEGGEEVAREMLARPMGLRWVPPLREQDGS